MCRFSTGRTEKFVESSSDPVQVLSFRNITTSGLKVKMSSLHHPGRGRGIQGGRGQGRLGTVLRVLGLGFCSVIDDFCFEKQGLLTLHPRLA